MKKKNVINLIKYHYENNESAFRNEAYEVAKAFDQSGDIELAEYVMGIVSGQSAFTLEVPNIRLSSPYLERMDKSENRLLLPEPITQDIIGLVHAIERDTGMHKFLFQGAPGTGKTEAVKHLSRILKRDTYMVEFSSLVDCKLGQTQKNLLDLFHTINQMQQPEKVIILFDEIDTIALDRTNQNDLREMGRVTSTLIRYLDRLNENVIFVATTNLFSHFDPALIRRFDAVIDFNRYMRDDLLTIAETLVEDYLRRFPCQGTKLIDHF